MQLRDEAADRRMAETPSLARYLPRILGYPLQGHGIPVTLFLATLLWFGMQSIFGIALFAIAAPWTFHYFEAVIEQSAHGRATPPNFGGDMIYLGGIRALAPLIGLGLIAAAYTLAFSAGPAARIAVLVAGALFYPAFLLVLTVEGSPVSALNPLKLAQAIAAVGAPYLGVCALLSLAAGVAVFAVNPAALFSALLISLYLCLVVFHMLGYVAFHHAAKLGLSLKAPPPTDESRALEAQQQRLAALLAKIDASTMPGDALKALLAEPGGPADLRLFHEELFEQLQVAAQVKRKPLIHAQGARLIALLLRERRAARALDIADTCYDFDRRFELEAPAHAVALAEAALQARRFTLFERLTHDAATRYANNPAAVSLAFLVAKHACDHGRDEERARELLKPLLNHTAHPWARQIAAYARALAPRTER